MNYRYVNASIPSRPDFSLFDKYLNADTMLCNLKTMYKIIVAKADKESFRNFPYDEYVYLKEDIRFDFEDKFKSWFSEQFKNEDIMLSDGGISITVPGSANTIHSDSHSFDNWYGKSKINIGFADYNSRFEWFKFKSEKDIYKHKDETGCQISCLDEKDATVTNTLNLENWYPVFIDVKTFHRRNNRNCKTPSYIFSYNIVDRNNKPLEFEKAEKILERVLLPKNYKFNLLSDV